MKNKHNITGQIYEEYIVLHTVKSDSRGTRWLCECIFCHKTKVIRRSSLTDLHGTTCNFCTNKRKIISKEGIKLINSMYDYKIPVKVIASTMEISLQSVYKHIKEPKRIYRKNDS